MSLFLRFLEDVNKEASLTDVSRRIRSGEDDVRVFELQQDAFDAVPGKPFAYWVSDAVRQTFRRLPSFEGDGRTVRVGLQSSDDFRFLRAWWEVNCLKADLEPKWLPFAKGGAYSPFYADVYLTLNWASEGAELGAFPGSYIRNPDYYFLPGLFQTLRAARLAPHLTPAGACFGHNGFQAFDSGPCLLSTLAILNSSAFESLYKLQLGRHGFAAYIAGTLQQTPIPHITSDQQRWLATLAQRAWTLRRMLDTVEETSHAFALPDALRARLGDYDQPAIDAELAVIHSEINDIAFNLYEFNEADRAAVQGNQDVVTAGDAEGNADVEGDDEDTAVPVDQTVGLLSWAIGVAFGRFDLRLANGEREAPAEPEPFDPLPAKSPGMLPDAAETIHKNAGILVDDKGHHHDLPHLVEEVLNRVDVSVPNDVRRWLRKDFFAFHMQRYSKSRRKAPIYWPLSTVSGSYTLWVYYPSLNNQTLFTAVNDFLDGPSGKLTQVSREGADLRIKGSGRSREEEKQYETMQAFEQELTDLRDTLLKIAPTYQPNHDDGVQITAAPLWPLFRHKPWQKVLKDTWTKLEKGDYDWAHLAMTYWPERVREKCKTDKSLAIAHGLEDLYEEPEVAPKKTRGKKKAGAKE